MRSPIGSSDEAVSKATKVHAVVTYQYRLAFTSLLNVGQVICLVVIRPRHSGFFRQAGATRRLRIPPCRLHHLAEISWKIESGDVQSWG
jgi:hypothetical protein